MPFSDSDPDTITLNLQGTWLHDPLDAESTAAQYLYGGPAKETSIDTMPAGTLYAGRPYAVTDYGEHEDESVSVTIHIPNGSTRASEVAELKAWARLRSAVWLRDGRGRSLPGTISAFREQDTNFGTSVAFTLSRVDYATEEVTV